MHILFANNLLKPHVNNEIAIELAGMISTIPESRVVGIKHRNCSPLVALTEFSDRRSSGWIGRNCRLLSRTQK
jgi:hypothetical protein